MKYPNILPQTAFTLTLTLVLCFPAAAKPHDSHDRNNRSARIEARDHARHHMGQRTGRPDMADPWGHIKDGRGKPEGNRGRPLPPPPPETDPVTPPAPEPDPVITPEPDPVIPPEPDPVITPEPDPVIPPEPDPVITPEPDPVTPPEPDPVIPPEPDPVTPPEHEPDQVLPPPTDPVPEPDPVITTLAVSAFSAETAEISAESAPAKQTARKKLPVRSASVPDMPF